MTEPGSPTSMSDFFGLEAGEYLERLDALLQTPDRNAEEVVRLARAVRGAALMANHVQIARAAAGFEALARAVREGRRTWEPATTQFAIRTIDELKAFVRRAARWTDADTAKAEAFATELERFAGRPSGPGRAVEPPGLDAGARAFIAREGAATASALDRAAQALRATPGARGVLQPALRALQPLRGLAVLADLPPLPDLLEGIERAAAEVERPDGPDKASAADLFQAAATAVARAAREVAEEGRPKPEGPEFQRFAALAVRFFQDDPNVVEVGALYFDDAGPHVVRQGAKRRTPESVGQLELVSHGEHLRQAADALERAPSPTQQALRAHTLATTFRALANLGGAPLPDALARFAVVARDVVTRGVALQAPDRFATLLRSAGDLLVRSGSTQDPGLATELDGMTTGLRDLAGVGAAPAEDVRVAESPDLMGSWNAYERLVNAGLGPASLDELLGSPSRDTGRPSPAPIPATAPAAPPTRATAAQDVSVVDIRTLLYRGEQALNRARELREEADRAPVDGLRALIDEVCDLVALALEPPPPR